MALKDILQKGVSNFLSGSDKGTAIDKFKQTLISVQTNRFQQTFCPMGLSLEGLRCDTAAH